jgi:hypothetical protein
MAISIAQFTIIQPQASSNPLLMSEQPPNSATMRFAITVLTGLDGDYLLLVGRDPRESKGGGIGLYNGSTSINATGTSVGTITPFVGVGSVSRHVNAALTYGMIAVWTLLVALLQPI